jgi:hypothetical protein
MRDSTVLPDLRILSSAALMPHEEIDPQRVERLCQRIRAEGRLKNPPVVAAIPQTDQFLVLDGASRTMAFNHMRIPHIVAQVVSYGDAGVTLDTWYHVVTRLPLETFEESLTQVTGLHMEACSLVEARAALSTHDAAAYIVCASGVRMVCNSTPSAGADLHLLNGIVNTYQGRAEIFRASNDSWEKQVPYYPHMTALVVFPQFNPSDLMRIVRNGEKVPTGVTRHVISPRAVNINISLEVLRADWPLDRKQEWLRDWLMERMATNAIRYYAEATFTFDE